MEAEGPKTKTAVLFVERPGLRYILSKDWEGAGVADHAETYWGPENDWTVLKDDLLLNEEQYARIILRDRKFMEIQLPVHETK